MKDLCPAPSDAPLAERLRPVRLSEVAGQEHLLGPGSPIERMIRTGSIASFVLWGPSGTGKTTIARLVAAESGRRFVPLSAVFSGVAELRKVFKEARRCRDAGEGTFLFVDEIHRFNRAQQDAFLPPVEDGTVLLAGATTENPSFELNSALLSRLQVLILRRLGPDSLEVLLRRAEASAERELPLDADARETLLAMADGDGRAVLNLAEQVFAMETEEPLGAAELASRLARRAAVYDKGQDEHYNLISALHKSVRGSDPDAALYWLYRMLDAGEDPLYIARRVVRMASEDIGLADPLALTQAVAAKDTYEFLGSPEGELAIAQAVVYCATSPKSNAVYLASKAARKAVAESGSLPPPMRILNAPTKLMRETGYGKATATIMMRRMRFPGRTTFPTVFEGTGSTIRRSGDSRERWFSGSGTGPDSARSDAGMVRHDGTMPEGVLRGRVLRTCAGIRGMVAVARERDRESMGVQVLRVDEDEDGMRLDRWLRRRFCGLPHARIGKLLRTGQIRVNGSRAQTSRRISAGDQVRMPPLRVAENAATLSASGVSPGDVRMFERLVLYRDRSLLAINKPSGLAVQGGTGQGRSVDRIAQAWAGTAGDTPRLVHRLDRDTSGVLLLALNRRSAVALSAAFRERRMRKTYWAAVAALPTPSRGAIAAPLAADMRTGRRQMRIASVGEPGAQDALTEYVTLATGEAGEHAWLALRPHTGRTHQLRSHLAAAGCPILGDARYRSPGRRGVAKVRRLCLHARSLEFPHPESGAMTRVCAPMDDALVEIWERMDWVESDAPDDPFPLA